MRIARSEDLSSLSRDCNPKRSLSEMLSSSLVSRCKNGKAHRNCQGKMFRFMKYYQVIAQVTVPCNLHFYARFFFAITVQLLEEGI